jgi:hypothetical protein
MNCGDDEDRINWIFEKKVPYEKFIHYLTFKVLTDDGE